MFDEVPHTSLFCRRLSFKDSNTVCHGVHLEFLLDVGFTKSHDMTGFHNFKVPACVV